MTAASLLGNDWVRKRPLIAMVEAALLSTGLLLIALSGLSKCSEWDIRQAELKVDADLAKAGQYRGTMKYTRAGEGAFLAIRAPDDWNTQAASLALSGLVCEVRAVAVDSGREWSRHFDFTSIASLVSQCAVIPSPPHSVLIGMNLGVLPLKRGRYEFYIDVAHGAQRLQRLDQDLVLVNSPGLAVLGTNLILASGLAMLAIFLAVRVVVQAKREESVRSK